MECTQRVRKEPGGTMKAVRKFAIDFVSLNHDDDLLAMLKVDLQEKIGQAVKYSPAAAPSDTAKSAGDPWRAKYPVLARERHAVAAR
jgi:hypothetical protein